VRVFVLVPTSVYDHGVVGVYSSMEDLRAAAAQIWPTTDGHHVFKVIDREVGYTHAGVFDRQLSEFDPRRPVSEAPVFVDEDGCPL
jgi:hypothetical protein